MKLKLKIINYCEDEKSFFIIQAYLFLRQHTTTYLLTTTDACSRSIGFCVHANDVENILQHPSICTSRKPLFNKHTIK